MVIKNLRNSSTFITYFSGKNGSENTYKSILDNLYDGVYFVDKDLKIIYWNNAAESSDTVARWGREEFVCLVENVNKKDVLTIAEKLRILVINSRVPFQDYRLNINVSIGATLAKRNDTVDSIIERVDKLIFESKLRGRNKVAMG